MMLCPIIGIVEFAGPLGCKFRRNSDRSRPRSRLPNRNSGGFSGTLRSFPVFYYVTYDVTEPRNSVILDSGMYRNFRSSDRNRNLI